MSKGKKLIIVMAVLVLVIAATVIFLPKLNADKMPVPENADYVDVFDFEQVDCDTITWRYNGEVNTFRRTEEGYFIAGAPDEGYDGTQVKYMVSAMAFLEAKKAIDQPAELSSYGIDESADPDVSVTLKDGSVHSMWFGDPTPTDKNYIYLWVGDGRVYLITDYTQPKFQYTLQDLIPAEEEDSESAA